MVPLCAADERRIRLPRFTGQHGRTVAAEGPPIPGLLRPFDVEANALNAGHVARAPFGRKRPDRSEELTV